ncbi:sm-like protein LSm1 [Diutina catenulata]
MNVEDLYLESYAFTTAAAIVGSVDRKIFVLLRDGRNVFGILRTFDQFANLVLQDAVERIYLDDDNSFGQAYRGVFMVRGENVVMMGELDIDKEDDHLESRKQIDWPEAEKRMKQIHREKIVAESEKSQRMLKQGLVNDFVKSDLY